MAVYVYDLSGAELAQIEGGSFLKYTFTDVLISGWSMSSGGDRPTESVSFNFAMR